MDFSKVVNKSNEGVWITLNDATGIEIEGVAVRILGCDSTAFVTKQRQITDKRLANQSLKLTAKELEYEALALNSVCVVEWKGIEDGDSPIECTEANVRKFMSDYPYVKEQIDRAINNRANFIESFKKD